MQLKPNITFASRYKLIKLIGTGGYSQVWLATDTVIDKQVALKIFATGNGLDDDALKTFSKEYSIVFDLSHPHLLIPKHYDQWERMPFLVMPYMEKGSCTKLCGKMTEKDLAKFLVQIGSAIEYLHSRKTPIIHQDIKPDNILIDEQGNYYLTDFGISTKIRRTLTKSMGNQKTNSSGTTAYMAPEKFSPVLKEREAIKANDIFALGVTIFELLTDELPYGDLGGIACNSGVQAANLPDDFSAEIQKLVSACLAKETWDRPTAEEVINSAKSFLEHGIWSLPEGPEPESTPLAKAIEAKEFENFLEKHNNQPNNLNIQSFYKFLVSKYGEIHFLEFENVLKEMQTEEEGTVEPLKLINIKPILITLGIIFFFVIIIAVISTIQESDTTATTQTKPQTTDSSRESSGTDHSVPEQPTINLSQVSATNITNIKETTATFSSSIANAGGGNIKERGFVISRNPNPTTNNDKVSHETAGVGDYSINISGFQDNTKYYVRAYAINEKGTAYGEERSFWTINLEDWGEPIIDLSQVSATNITNIKETTATFSSSIANAGGGIIKERGFVISRNPNPTTNNDKVSHETTGVGDYSINISGFQDNTKYYVRAYAINEKGTAYGEERSFRTTQANSGTFTDSRDGKTYKWVRIGNQVWMAENLNYNTGYGSWCYSDKSSNCNKYGRLYNWEAAKTVCPPGWKLPSKTDFETLLRSVGGSGSTTYNALIPSGNSGFSALFGGWRSRDGRFHAIGSHGYFWSSSPTDSTPAWRLYLASDGKHARMGSSSRSVGFSVRCLQV